MGKEHEPQPEDRARGQLIRAARQALGWTHEQLAERAGVHRTTVTNVENGRQSLGLRAAAGVARALGIPLETVADPGAALSADGAEIAASLPPAPGSAAASPTIPGPPGHVDTDYWRQMALHLSRAAEQRSAADASEAAARAIDAEARRAESEARRAEAEARCQAQANLASVLAQLGLHPGPVPANGGAAPRGEGPTAGPSEHAAGADAGYNGSGIEDSDRPSA